jgi:hypothetical protein
VDNTGAIDELNGGSLREAPSQSLLREIFLIALSLNFSILCIWIDSKSHYVADALSRVDMYRQGDPEKLQMEHTLIWAGNEGWQSESDLQKLAGPMVGKI